MASLFEYEKEAIRIKARRVDRGQEEQRKFSVDPNITSFEVVLLNQTWNLSKNLQDRIFG